MLSEAVTTQKVSIMTRSKPTGRVCMFLVGVSLIVLILFSYKWFMVPSGGHKERKEVLLYKQRLQQNRNQKYGNFGRGRGRNYFDDKTSKSRFDENKQNKFESKNKFENQNKFGDQQFGGKQDLAKNQQFQNKQNDLSNKQNKETKESAEVKAEPSPKMAVPQSATGVSTIKSLYKDADPLYSDTFKQLVRIVHLDLKGAPPNMEYLRKLFPFFSKLGATAVLMEYEDMFPYTDDLSQLAAGNHYTKENIQTISNLAKDNNLDIIPLVQTFGHLEFALKSKQFSNLRESEMFPTVINPGKNQTYAFLFSMLDQVMALHSGKKYIHLGSDEVYNLGKGRSKKMLKGNMTVANLFFKHVKRVAQYVKEKHNVRPIIWDDMFRSVDAKVLKDSKIGNYVDPMVWCYLKNPKEKLPKGIWAKYRRTFKAVFIASAFKGATGASQFATDAAYHIENHLSWVDILKKEVINEQGTMKLSGVAITGWQRYDHFATLCELLPAAIPSLAANLQIFSTGGFNENNHKAISELLNCKQKVQLELCTNQTNDQCEFPGSEVYYNIRKLWRVKKMYNKNMEKYRAWASDYNLKNGFSSPFRVKMFKKNFIAVAGNATKIEKFMWNGITALFDKYTAAEFIDVHIRQMLNKIPDRLRNLNLLLQPKTWPQRPLKTMIMPADGTDGATNQEQSNQNQISGQNQLPQQNQFPRQNQTPQKNQLSGQNQYQNQLPRQGEKRYQGQNQFSSQNQYSGQNQLPRRNQFQGQNQYPGKVQLPGQNQLGGQQSQSSQQNQLRGQNQFTGQNQLPRQDQGQGVYNRLYRQRQEGSGNNINQQRIQQKSEGFGQKFQSGQKYQNNPYVNNPQQPTDQFGRSRESLKMSDHMQKLQELANQGDRRRADDGKKKELNNVRTYDEKKSKDLSGNNPARLQELANQGDRRKADDGKKKEFSNPKNYDEKRNKDMSGNNQAGQNVEKAKSDKTDSDRVKTEKGLKDKKEGENKPLEREGKKGLLSKEERDKKEKLTDLGSKLVQRMNDKKSESRN